MLVKFVKRVTIWSFIWGYLQFRLRRSLKSTEACVAYAKQAGTRSKRMHWMDARALRRKDAFRGERPCGDTVCDPWISDRETVFTSVASLRSLDFSNLAN
ncbi:UNVERIFIED_CONTAM: hypothetical protein Sradi_6095700 [Sesamum radiatum]|uniref:Secreted protein n=1 Tax=Sesamum radiatum TaxID=300843 RepID=A0AAW2KIW4_SESRA